MQDYNAAGIVALRNHAEALLLASKQRDEMVALLDEIRNMRSPVAGFNAGLPLLPRKMINRIDTTLARVEVGP
jgi:hypothetical protein